MSLLADIRAEQEAQSGPKCSFQTVMASLTPEDAADVLAAIDEGRKSSAISRALRKRGVDLGEYTIARHRRGGCSCR